MVSDPPPPREGLGFVTLNVPLSEPLMTSYDLTVSIERAANTLVYTDGTQGWLLKNK